MKVLLIDDDKTSRDLLGHLARKLGLEAVLAEDGHRALEVLADNDPDQPFAVAVVDWDMPNMNGIEFVRAVRKNPTFDNLKLLMATCHNSITEVAEALETGANEYLMKPITTETFLTKLQLLGLMDAESLQDGLDREAC